MSGIKINLAIQQQLVREGLASMIANEPFMEVVMEAADGRTALDQAVEVKPDIIIIDRLLPELNGVDTVRHILKLLPKTKFIALSEKASYSSVQEIIQAGATAYILQSSSFLDLKNAIFAVTNNESYLCSRISISSGEKYNDKNGALSSREREVLQLLAEGKSTKEIAETLIVSVKTIDNHRQNIMKKLDLHCVADLTRWAINEGITPLIPMLLT